MHTVFFIAHQTSKVRSHIPQHAQWRLPNMELLSRENASAQLCQNKLEYHPMVWLFYVFLMTVGWWWGSVAQRHRLQVVAAQTALVSEMNSLLFLVFLWALLNKNKKDKVTPAWFLNAALGATNCGSIARMEQAQLQCTIQLQKGSGFFFTDVQLRTVATYSSSSTGSPTCPRPKAACRLHNDLPSVRWMAWRYHWGCWD